MKISIAPKEGAYKTLTLSIDDEPWRDIHISVFGRRPKFENITSLAEFELLFNTLEYQRAKIYAIRRLSVKSQNSSQLRKALETRLVSASNTQRLIQEFANVGYINDEEWTKSFIRQQIARKVGPKVILMKLKIKGIPPRLAERIFEEFDHSPRDQIRQLLQTRYKNRNIKDYREKQKVIGALVRKGFDIPDVIHVMGLTTDDY